MEEEGAVQGPFGAPVAVEMSQVEDFFKSMIDSLTSKLTNKIDEKLQSFTRQIVEEQSSSSSPEGNSLAGGFLKGLQNLVSKRASGSNIICPCFSSFVHKLCGFDCATLLGNNKMFAVFIFSISCIVDALRAE